MGRKKKEIRNGKKEWDVALINLDLKRFIALNYLRPKSEWSEAGHTTRLMGGGNFGGEQ